MASTEVLPDKATKMNSLFGTDSHTTPNITPPFLTRCLTDMTTDFDFTMGADMKSSTPYPSFDTNVADVSIDFNTSSFESVNSPAVNLQTVSPKDVLMDTSYPAPPSAALTNLSTPQTQTWDSPFIAHSTDTSPLFSAYDNDADLGPEANNWESLFPNEPAMQPDVKPTIEAASPVDSLASTEMSYTHSSPGGRRSATSGVKKTRGRKQPLPELDPESAKSPLDKKRIKNTLAARKSRGKKFNEREDHLSEIQQLKHELNQTKAELERYRTALQTHMSNYHSDAKHNY